MENPARTLPAPQPQVVEKDRAEVPVMEEQPGVVVLDGGCGDGCDGPQRPQHEDEGRADRGEKPGAEHLDRMWGVQTALVPAERSTWGL